MTIKAGDKIPSSTLKTMGEKGPTDITTAEIFKGKKVVLFAVPGAFTPGCSNTHLPGYVANADKIKAAGVDTIVCMADSSASTDGGARALTWDKNGKATSTAHRPSFLLLGDSITQFGARMDTGFLPASNRPKGG